MTRTAIAACATALAFGAGFYAGRSGPATVRAQEQVSRPSTSPIPAAWGEVKGVIGHDEITLVLEDERGTIRAVTLQRSMAPDGRKAVTPYVFAVVERR